MNLSNNVVQAKYKTGKYVAEVVEKKDAKTLIKILAVLKHPVQGDLHNPKQVDVPLFHQRKALAQFEKVWVPTSTVKEYEGDVPDYKESLHQAFMAQYDQLKDSDDEWSQAALRQLEDLKSDYRFSS
ncbi:kinase-associated lipoprotein B [Salsuginibacillus kocurii]|uniref:kinase-associated lipoprotein B n=1 Tax=Salsuginibacillus kocurii TaxID=427078 RepID=UPI00035CEA41|nr:kinase-associated lipoprotein B [Salsuginibacillus kocurii]